MPGTPSEALTEAVALVTGAGRGIGTAIATALADLKTTVVLCGRTRKDLDAVAQSISKRGGKSRVVPCDVSDLRSVEAAAADVKQNHGRLDILVNNAGIGSFSKPLHETDPGVWDDTLNTNLRGVYYMIRCFAPMMIQARNGHIINISSLAGKNPVPNGAAYAASKWGLNGLSYTVAEELRVHNIRVSVICPGSVNTDLSPHTGKKTQKMLQPGDIAHTVAMLVTQASQSFVSEILIRPTQKP